MSLARANQIKLRGSVMSIVSETLEIQESKAVERRKVAGIVNSIETLEGGAFWSVARFLSLHFQDLIRSCYSMRWDRWMLRRVRRKARRIIRIVDLRL